MARQKITELAADTAPDGADLVVTVDDVAGTPTTKKATLANLTKGLDVFVASGASSAKGLVPDPGAVAGTTKFLREDATFVVPTANSGPAATSSPMSLYSSRR